MRKPDPQSLERFAKGNATPEEVTTVANWLAHNPTNTRILEDSKMTDVLLLNIQAASRLNLSSVGNIQFIIEKVCDATQVDGLSTVTSWEPPTNLDHYKIVRVLGRGGMGVVCEAIDQRLNRHVAIKMMRAELMGIAEHQQRFMQEAQAIATVEHESIVPVLSAGESNQLNYIVMPLLQGETLACRLRRGQLSIQAILQVASDLSSGLAAAHHAGIIHRDLKPSNIWLESRVDGSIRRARVFDFGLARSLSTSDRLTQSNQVLGTPGYMAPEQVQNGDCDERTDVFSLGCVLYEAAIGHKPFEGKSLLEVLSKLLTSVPPPLVEQRPELPRELSQLISRMMASEPDKRPRSMDDIAESLEQIRCRLPQSQELVAGTPEPNLSTIGRKFSRRNIWIATGLIPILFGAIALGVVITIKQPNGTETWIELPSDSKVTIQGQGDLAVTIESTSDLDTGIMSSDTHAHAVPSNKSDRVTASPGTGSPSFLTERKSLEMLLKINSHVVLMMPDGRRIVASKSDDFVEGSTIVDLRIQNNSRLTDAVFAQCISNLRSLEWLEVSNSSQLTDLALFYRSISRMKKLQVLIATLPLTDEYCDYVSQCPELSYLQRFEARFTKAGAERLLLLSKLKDCSFFKGNCRDEDVAPLLQLPLLESIGLPGCLVTGDFLRGESALQSIRSIDLSVTQVTDDTLQHLWRFPNLTSLKMEVNQITGKGFIHLSELSKLSSVNFHGCQVNDPAGLAALVRAPALESLDLHVCPIDDACVSAIATSTKLKNLDLTGAKITEQSMKTLAEMPNLQSLTLFRVNVKQAALQQLARFKSLTHLSVGSPHLDDETIRVWTDREAPWLVLWIYESQLSDACIPSLAKFVHLKSLRLFNSQITDEGLERLRSALPNTDIGR